MTVASTGEAQHVIIVSGLSGAGKSTALKALEDMGYHCIDNLPPPLLEDFARHLQAAPDRYRRVALGMDVRAASLDPEPLAAWLERLREGGIRTEVLFLDARDEMLLKRFGETRRRHPLAQGEGGLAAAIEKERELLAPLQALASWTIDTTDTNVHQLTHQTWRHVGPDTERMTVVVQSFGFSQGVPMDVDYLFDARCLPNPHWDDGLRPLSGRDGPVAEWLEQEPLVTQLAEDIEGFLLRWLPAHEATHRSFITVAIGCTGGRHRSVYLAERLVAALQNQFPEVVLHHRELAS
ncbi:MAG: RNase adapter RapZ [Pseudomonadota bacterium]